MWARKRASFSVQRTLNEPLELLASNVPHAPHHGMIGLHPARPRLLTPFPCRLCEPPQALGGPNNQPGPDDWVLEEFWHDDEMHLLDRKNGKLYTVPGENGWPRPVGM